MYRHRSLSLIALALVLALPAMANDGPIAKATYSSTFITWSPIVEYELLHLTVLNDDGLEWNFTFKPGTTPAFSLKSLGSDLADGPYVYELRIKTKISDSTLSALKRAREAGDDREAIRIMKAAGLSKPVTQTGSFAVANGVIVPNTDEEKSARDSNASRVLTTNAGGGSGRPGEVQTDDQVIPDDLIVQGSLCVGFDCVNNESFGFDTIRLKENNTRIKFEDTSVGTFPTNDWQLTANDSASGGSSKFSIEDITGARVPFTVEAGATTNSIFVDSTGRVGFRTSTPVLDLHVNTSNTPGIRLEQNNSGGFTAQTWDIAGNEANFFVRDVTGGSLLPFRIRPGAPTSSLDISASGFVGVGTASPDERLHVFSAATDDAIIGIGNDPDAASALNIGYGGLSFGRGAGFFNTRPDASAVAPNPSLRFLVANTLRLIIDNEGFLGLGVTNPSSPIHHSTGALLTAAGVWQSVSSREAKQDINPLSSEEAMAAFKQLQPVTYEYKNMPEDRTVGFIAEEVPDLVATPERKTLSEMDIVAVLTKVVQEQQKTIEQLNERLSQVEKQK